MSPRQNLFLKKGTCFSLGNIFWIILFAAILILHEVYFYDYTIDDAYISFRYAENFVNGEGLVFNAGERVEGYSNFLWILLISLFIRVGLPTVAVAKILGMIFSVLSVLVLYRMSLFISKEKSYFNIVSAFLLCFCPAYALWAVAGLETLFYSFLLLSAIFRYIKEWDNENSFPASSILFALVALARPEGIVFFALSLLHKLFYLPKNNKRIRKEIYGIGLFILILGGHLIWRYSYYGDLLPNTYYAKMGRGLRQHLGGLFYTYEYIKNYGGFVLFLFPIVLLFKKPVTFWRSFLLLIYCSYFILVIYMGADNPPQFRFFVPLIPVTYLLWQEGYREVYKYYLEVKSGVKHKLRKNFFVLCSVFLALLFISFSLSTDFLMKDPDSSHRGYGIHLNVNGSKVAGIGRRLREIAPPNATIAVLDAGAIPYYSKLRTIDRLGLADVHIARSKPQGVRREKYDPEYVLSQEPAYIQTHIFLSDCPEKAYESGEIRDDLLLQNEKFRKFYSLVDDPGLVGIFQRREK